MTGAFRPRWPLLMVLIAGVGIVIGITYLPSEPSGRSLPAQGGSYVEGVAGEPVAINPLFATFNDADRDLASLVFSGLVRLGPKGDVQPDLADTPNVTPDGLNYIFELRTDVFWHDGERLDADDVLFTVRLIQDPDFAGDPVLADLFRGVELEAPDAQTVIMTLPSPFAPFLARGATVGILPEHLLSGVSAAALRDAPFNRRPIGSGPFTLVDLTSSGAVLEPFGSYHLGRPFLERLELRFYPDGGALLNALLGDVVDGALFRPGIGSDEIALIEGDERWVRRVLHTTTYSLVYLNALSAPFDDRFVRNALQRGLDTAALIERVLDGQAVQLDSPIVPDLWSHVGSPEEYGYDPALAGTLLDTAGWMLEDGVRMKEGEPLQLTLAVSDDTVQVAVAEELARQWRELGIGVELEVSGASQFVEGVLLPRAFEAALVTVDPGPDPDPYPLWHSSQVFGDGRNLASFSDADVDRLLENGRQASSAADRAEAYRLFQEIFAREQPAVLLHTLTYQYVVRADLQGVSPGLLLSLSSRFDDAYRWFIETGTQADEAG